MCWFPMDPFTAPFRRYPRLPKNDAPVPLPVRSYGRIPGDYHTLSHLDTPSWSAVLDLCQELCQELESSSTLSAWTFQTMKHDKHDISVWCLSFWSQNLQHLPCRSQVKTATSTGPELSWRSWREYYMGDTGILHTPEMLLQENWCFRITWLSRTGMIRCAKTSAFFSGA